MSLICSRCGGPTVELFLSRACKAECDLRTDKLPAVLNGEQALEALLAHKAIQCEDWGFYFDPAIRWFKNNGPNTPWGETTHRSAIRGCNLYAASKIIRDWFLFSTHCKQSYTLTQPPTAE